MTARELAAAVRGGTLRAADATAHALARVDARRELNAIVHRDDEAALARARALDARRAAGKALGPLAGVPVAVKDNICTRGLVTSCGSRILAGYVPPYDATVVERLLAADAVVIGKSNCDEFAMGSSNENSCHGPVRHPEDPERVPGGSSGGSAAAVAAGLVPVALGSDTGGSVRQPAAFCGIVGVKPTYGRVSRRGLVAFGSSLDQVGPLCRDVRDAALVLSVIAGPDARDATCSDAPLPPDLAAPDSDLRGKRVGLLASFTGSPGVEARVQEAVREAGRALADAGAAVEEVDLPLAPYGISIYYLVAPSEASSNLARFDGVRYGARAPHPEDVLALYEKTRGAGFGTEVKRRIVLGTYALSAGYYDAYYGRALAARGQLRRQIDDLFARADLLLLPTAPSPAFRLGEKIGDPVAMYLSDIFTVLANLGGHPAISVPAPRRAGALPLGVQLMAPAFGEPALLGAALALEERGFAAG